MLTEDKNRQLTEVGPGTPMGDVLRRQLFHDIEAVQSGRDPKCVLRDASRNHQLVQPSDSRDFFQHGLSLADCLRHPKWARLLCTVLFMPARPTGCSKPTARPRVWPSSPWMCSSSDRFGA